jgi:hypothetical protein
MSAKQRLAALTTIAAFAVAANASAQGRGGPPMDPEKQAAAWKLESQGVAHELSLDDAAAMKLAEAYAAARKAQGAEMETLRGTGERGPGMFQQMQEINAKERSKLGDALNGFLTEEQTTKALAPLGTFNNQWDRMADVISGFKLEDEKLYKALALISKYVVESDEAREKAMASGDFQSVRDSMQELKAGLDKSLADVLSEEQLATWTEATASRGGRGGGGGGGRGGNN